MRASLWRIRAVIGKEFRQLVRDRMTFGMIVGIPALQIVLFGYAINTDVRHLAAGVYDAARTQSSQRLVADLVATQVVQPPLAVDSVEALETLLRQGRIKVGIYVPADFQRRLVTPGRPAVQILADGGDPLVFSAVQKLNEMPVMRKGSPPASRLPPLLSVRNYYNPERRTTFNIVPGLIGVILTLTMVLFTAVAIVRERERGNLEFLINTPVHSAELMLGKLVPYVLIGLVQTTLILLLGVSIFNIPVVGSLLDVYIAASVFILATLTLGLVISTLAQTQMQAMQMTILVFLPSLLLSGFLYPFEGMPVLARFLGELLPLTHFVRLIRGIVLRGADIGDMMASIWALLAFGIFTFGIAVARFRKRLD